MGQHAGQRAHHNDERQGLERKDVDRARFDHCIGRRAAAEKAEHEARPGCARLLQGRHQTAHEIEDMCRRRPPDENEGQEDLQTEGGGGNGPFDAGSVFAQQPEAAMKDDESGKRLYNRHGRVSRMGIADHTAAARARGSKP